MKHHQHHKTSLVQIAWVIAGLILLLGCLLALKTPNEQIVNISTSLGLCMLFAGLINLFICLKKFGIMHGVRWLLADSMSTILLSIFPLFNQITLPGLIPFFFGVWELFSGIVKSIDASELKHEKIKGWQSFLVIGFIEIVSGASSLVKPIDDFVGIHIVISIILLVQASGFFIKACMYHSLTDE